MRGTEPAQQHAAARAGCWLLSLLMLCVCLSASAVEREFYFDRIDNENGLLQNSVLSLLQASDATVWIGTQGALHQFDGYRFRLFEHDPDNPNSLPDSAITALVETLDGKIWVGTSASGVSRLDPASGRFDSFTLAAGAVDRNAREAVTSLLLDPTRGLWIGTRGGLDLLSSESNGREHFVPADLTSGIGIVRDLMLAGDGNTWIASSTGLWRILKGKDQLEQIAKSSISDAYSVFESREHVLYAGISRGLLRLDANTGAAELVWHGEQTTTVHAIVEDKIGKLWLAVSDQGLVILEPRSLQARWIRPDSKISGSLPQGAVTRLMVDQSGLLWVGSDSLGLSKVDPNGATFTMVADRNP